MSQPSLNVDNEGGVGEDKGDEAVGDDVGQGQGQPKPGHARNNQFLGT